MNQTATAIILADYEDIEWDGGTGQADVLISCGDVPDAVILEAAEAHGCRRILAVKGNHDLPTPFPPPIEDIHLNVVEIDGVRFGGLQGAWRYKPRGHFLYSQEEASRFLAAFPHVDVLVCHNSPAGVHDRNDGVHYGFKGITTYIEMEKPMLVVHGHQHVNAETVIGQTTVVGVHGHRLLHVRTPPI